MLLRLGAIFFGCCALVGCSTLPAPQTVKSVDLSRYTGEWYEIESFPNWFQRGCTDARARYTPRADGQIDVVNTCVKNGRTVSIRGVARPVPGSHHSKLKVRFFGPFEGDYWILDLDPDYRWVPWVIPIANTSGFSRANPGWMNSPCAASARASSSKAMTPNA